MVLNVVNVLIHFLSFQGVLLSIIIELEVNCFSLWFLWINTLLLWAFYHVRVIHHLCWLCFLRLLFILWRRLKFLWRKRIFRLFFRFWISSITFPWRRFDWFFQFFFIRDFLCLFGILLPYWIILELLLFLFLFILKLFFGQFFFLRLFIFYSKRNSFLIESFFLLVLFFSLNSSCGFADIFYIICFFFADYRWIFGSQFWVLGKLEQIHINQIQVVYNSFHFLQ